MVDAKKPLLDLLAVIPDGVRNPPPFFRRRGDGNAVPAGDRFFSCFWMFSNESAIA
jgi:hypothetical protein